MLSYFKTWTHLSQDKPTSEEPVNADTKPEDISVTPDATSSNKVMVDKANEWGSYLLKAGKTVTNIAAKQVTDTAKQLRQNVSEMNIIERGNIISDFTNEQNKFKSEKRCLEKKKNEVSLPWIDALNSDEGEEQKMKMKILSVSSDERNFTRNPPAGSDFEFNCALYSPVALLLLKEDPQLAAMRFKLVPKRIKEEIFWRNYFYRISLIKQSFQKEQGNERIDTEDSVKTLTSKGQKDDGSVECIKRDDDSDDSDVQQLKIAMVDSGVFTSKRPNDNDDWEAELQKELSEFELVNEENGKDSNDPDEKVDFDDLEKEIMFELEK